MIYKISKYKFYEKWERPCDYMRENKFSPTEFVDVILISMENPNKKKVITVKLDEFNPNDYKIGFKYDIKKFLWFEKWEWLQPE